MSTPRMRSVYSLASYMPSFRTDGSDCLAGGQEKMSEFGWVGELMLVYSWKTREGGNWVRGGMGI